MTTAQEFIPRWACSPGATIQDLITSKNVNPAEVAEACGLGRDEFNRLLQGSVPITGKIAVSLAQNLGGSASFWLRREERFRESEAIVEADQWVQSLPLSSMKKLAWLEVPRDWRARIDACLGFFGMDSLESWKHSYADQLQTVRFRTSPSYPNQVSSVSSWLRAGEIAHQGFTGGNFDPDALLSALPELRKLTRIADPEEFIPRLQSLAARCGVSCVIVPAPEGCAASGASRVLADGSALIQLSGRYLSDDQFWFSFFHEVAHLLLHKDAALHVDGDPAAFETDSAESEANTFSADVLWPFEHRPSSVAAKKPSRRDIVRLASRAGTSPGIIAGQLQSSGVLDHAECNNLKRRYKRVGSRLLLKK
ncbi:ImmA/IrrE family metallo-endopeptidase [Arthrobacter sp. ok362]|uniref:ImmA/IrrE family metallo-endopeptidase n=1 Tax=Arthrobacter sp. ok362 TaxID=1761745 RepID=UPI000888F484|nr:ImmA/IrrE family metallo-endopeptidase [Arthrobacter sp. ok362]SDL62338.1 Plasmid maintenance system antidote protein VapI, contains XRE-type HTH domain [Arthrobacter sp. ok362]